ncbi:hypothetical protein Mapa_014430 [Marchantia paleacea]|nr:hypothetical protein Mapa_014430 [Marchantia paleacea]
MDDTRRLLHQNSFRVEPCVSDDDQQVMSEYDFTPSTATSSSSWVLPNLLVKVGRDGLGAFPGIVREVMLEGKCLIALAESTRGEHVMASESELTMIVPCISDDVKIVSGEYRHKTGKLVEIVEGRGLVLLADGIGLKYIDMKSIGKLEFVRESFPSEYDSSTDDRYVQRQEGHVPGSNIDTRRPPDPFSWTRKQERAWRLKILLQKHWRRVQNWSRLQHYKLTWGRKKQI